VDPIAEDEVKVAASADHVEVAFYLSKWPLVLRGQRSLTVCQRARMENLSPGVPERWPGSFVVDSTGR
jgi:hypothetical protein